jgi:hypothetical protein
MSWHSPTNRRAFLRGAGGFTLTLPFLPSLAPRAQAAQAPPPRYIQIYNKYGYQFFPSGNLTRAENHVEFLKLTDINGSISSVLGSEFDSLKGKINVLRGLDLLSAQGHNSAGCTTASTDPQEFETEKPYFPYSIDAVLEESDKFYQGAAPKIRALRLGPGLSSKPSSYSYSSKSGSMTRLPYQKSATALFDNLFKGLPANAGAPPEDLFKVEKRVANLVADDYRRLSASGRLGAEDKRSLSNFIDLLNELEKSLAAPAMAAACDKVPLAAATTNEEEYRNHFKLATAALACGITRVVSIAMMDYKSTGYHGEEYHDHRQADSRRVAQRGWQAKRLAELIRGLDAITESNGKTMLDNSVVYFGTDSIWNHRVVDMPVLLAGGLGGKLKTGYFIDYRQKPLRKLNTFGNTYAGRPYNELLVTLMQALGLDPSDYQKFGKKGFGTYDFNGSYAFHNASYYTEFFKRDRNQPLPFLLNGTV